MRIGINAHLLAGETGFRQAGVSRYLEGVLSGLPAVLDPADELVVWAARGVAAPTPALSSGWQPSLLLTTNPLARIAWEQTVLPLLARRARLDLFHGPVNVAPPLIGCPTVVTVHDLGFVRFPETLRSGRRRYLTAATRASVHRAARVIAVSASTKRDLVELLDTDPARIAVVPLAADQRFRPMTAGEQARFRAAKGLDRPYILAVGTLEPRKNLPLLIRAFARVAPELPHDLIVVGGVGWLSGEVPATIERLGLGERVRLLGFGAPAELPGWYGAADLFVFPSLFEGFGLPPLEAMACGAPVISSNAASLPEVVGEAAISVDPTDEAGFAAAIRTVLFDAALAADLGARGLARAAKFSWQRTAAATMAVYREASGEAAR
jgi:glycosyltransferase involved in cell wall biosynthesis